LGDGENQHFSFLNSGTTIPYSAIGSKEVWLIVYDRAFLGTGQGGTSRYDDMGEFKPEEEYNEDD
jgi:hypothetical protein